MSRRLTVTVCNSFSLSVRVVAPQPPQSLWQLYPSIPQSSAGKRTRGLTSLSPSLPSLLSPCSPFLGICMCLCVRRGQTARLLVAPVGLPGSLLLSEVLYCFWLLLRQNPPTWHRGLSVTQGLGFTVRDDENTANSSVSLSAWVYVCEETLRLHLPGG